MDLESRNAALQSELDNLTPAALSRRNQDPASWLPKAPPRHTLESHRNAINCVAFHPVFSSIASGSDDYTIKIWDWEMGELERTVKGHTRAVVDLDYGGPKGNVLLASCSSDLTVKLWDPSEDYKNIRTLPGHDHSVSAVRFVPSSGNLLVSASRDQTLKIWDTSTGYCVKTMRGHAGWVRDVSPSHDGRFLLSTGDDMTARLWDLSAVDPEIRATMMGHDHVIECCALAPPTSYRYIVPFAGMTKPPPPGNTAAFMATGSRDKTIKLWSWQGTCLRTLSGHDNWVRALAFHPGGKYLLSVSDDKTIRCWDLSQDGKCVRVIQDSHDRFITCLKWVPTIRKGVASEDDSFTGGGPDGESNRTRKATPAAGLPSDVQLRCVVATGGVDCRLRIFAG